MPAMNLSTLQNWLEPWLVLIADDPALRLLQAGMVALFGILIFLVFYTTRDILLRTQSFTYMFFCIVMVALLPVVGFMLYILVRPAHTTQQRELYRRVAQLSKS